MGWPGATEPCTTKRQVMLEVGSASLHKPTAVEPYQRLPAGCHSDEGSPTGAKSVSLDVDVGDHRGLTWFSGLAHFTAPSVMATTRNVVSQFFPSSILRRACRTQGTGPLGDTDSPSSLVAGHGKSAEPQVAPRRLSIGNTRGLV